MSQAMVPAAGSRRQKKTGIKDSARLMVDDILRKNKNGSDPDLTFHIAGQSGHLIDWLENEMGIRFELLTDFLYPGHSLHRIHANKSRKGKNLINELLDAAAPDPERIVVPPRRRPRRRAAPSTGAPTPSARASARRGTQRRRPVRQRPCRRRRGSCSRAARSRDPARLAPRGRASRGSPTPRSPSPLGSR